MAKYFVVYTVSKETGEVLSQSQFFREKQEAETFKKFISECKGTTKLVDYVVREA